MATNVTVIAVSFHTCCALPASFLGLFVPFCDAELDDDDKMTIPLDLCRPPK